MKKKVLFSAILSIMLCTSLIMGATFALFTSESTTNIAITSGKVSVIATIDEESIQTKQLNKEFENGNNHLFSGEATIDANELTLNNLVPGDGIKFDIKITNNSTVAVQYRVKMQCIKGTGTLEESQQLFGALTFKLNNQDFSQVVKYASAWETLQAGTEPSRVAIEIELPQGVGNDYQDLSTKIVFAVEAVQGNASVTAGEEYVRLDGSAQLADNGVQISLPAGTTEGSVTLTVEKPATSPTFIIDESSGVTAQVQVLNINLTGLKEGNTEEIIVTIPVNKKMQAAVVYYNNDGVLEAMTTEYKLIDDNHFIQFKTTHFSEYILFEEPIVANVKSKTESESTASPFMSLAAAIEAANDGDVVTLYQNIQVTQQITINKDIILDLGGYTIDGVVGNPFAVSEGASVGYTVRNQAEVTFAMAEGYKTIAISKNVSEMLTVEGDGYTITATEQIVYNKGIKLLDVRGDNNTIIGLNATTTLPRSQRIDDTNDYNHAIRMSGNNNTLKDCSLSLGAFASSSSYGSIITINDRNDNSITTIDNVIFGQEQNDSANRAIQIWHLGGTLNIKDSTLDSVRFTFNVDSFNNTGEIIVTNTNMNGWTSYTSGGDVEFNSCTFDKNYTGEWNFIRPYSDTVFNDCSFTETTISSTTSNLTFTFNNCTYNETLLTAENFDTTVTTAGDGISTLTVIIDGKEVHKHTVGPDNPLYCTECEVYAITSAADLMQFAQLINNNQIPANSTVKLFKDIDLTDKVWIPMMVDSRSGMVFDGNDRTIKGLTSTGHIQGGLFGRIGGGWTIKNLTMKDVTITGKFDTVQDAESSGGAIVGWLENHGSDCIIENCTVDGITITNVKYGGGLIGYRSGGSTINLMVNDCEVKNVLINSSYTVGGVIGHLGGGTTTIKNIKGSNITVNGTKREGGMVGALSGSTLHITEYVAENYVSTVGGNASANTGPIVGLVGNTYINGEEYTYTG